ncbi:4Fe-4S cluster-binding domain-containing protein, partial [Bacillus sp. B-TM1]
ISIPLQIFHDFGLWQPKQRCGQPAKIVKDLKKNLWMYTGYTLEEIQSSQNNDMIELLHYGDVLVDGRFEIEKKDLTLPFRGSSNQRIIRLKE